MEKSIVYKRKTREVSQATRDKISAKLKGVKKSATHCRHISQGMRADTGGYWSHIPKNTNQLTGNLYDE